MIQPPYMTMADDSFGLVSLMIESSSRTFQYSLTSFGQRRRSLGQPDWIVLGRICIDWSSRMADLIFSIHASLTVVWRILKIPIYSLRSLWVRISCIRTPSPNRLSVASGCFSGRYGTRCHVVPIILIPFELITLL